MRSLIRFIHISALLLLLPLGAQAVEIKTPLQAVQALGHEMSEMRHMLETFAMIGTGVTFQLPKEQLKRSVALYEEVIATIEKGFSDEAIQKQVAIGRKGWTPVKQALEAALEANPSHEAMKKGAIYVHGNIRTVIKAMESMKATMLTKAKFKAIKELNAAIEIDASARRLSAHYAMWMWELPDPTIEAHWQKGAKIYAKSLEILEASAFATDPAFKALLDTARQQLSLFGMMHKMAEHKRFTPALAQTRAAKASDAAIKMAKVILAK